MEKIRIPDAIQDLHLMEYQVLSKPWQPTLQFTVSPDTQALTIFIQDRFAGASALIPPSMFKTINNSDLKLYKIQVSYAGVNKPSTPWESDFGGGIDQLQQRYFDSFKELGLDTAALGSESYYDYLQRGAFYHFSFIRDVNSRATQVSVTSSFTGLPNGPTSGSDGTQALVYCVAHFRSTARVTHSSGRVANVEMLR